MATNKPMSQRSHYSTTRLQRALADFLLGKGVTAVLSFTAFALVARHLTASDYGTYSAMLALMELTLGLAPMGLDWVMGRVVPEYRLCASGRLLGRLILQLILLQMVILAIFGSAIALGAQPIGQILRVSGSESIIRIYAAVAVVEGMGRVVRDQTLSALLLQGGSQIAQASRMALMVGLLLLNPIATLTDVAHWELLAATLGCIVSLAFLITHLFANLDQTAGDPNWQPVAPIRMFRLARDTYLSSLLWLAYGPYVFTLILTRLIGLDATALFGFARNFSEQVRRFLPAQLFSGLIRPMLIARYVATGDFVDLNRQVQLLLKISLCALAPVLAFVAVFNTEIANFLSRGKLSEAGPLLLVLLLIHVPGSGRHMLDNVANIVHQAGLCVRAGLPLLLLPVLAVVLLKISKGVGAFGVVNLILLGELAYNALAIRLFRLHGLPYSLDWRGLFRLALATGITVIVVAALPLYVSPDSLLVLVTGAICITVVFVLLLWWLSPFCAAERKTLADFLIKVRPNSIEASSPS